MKCKTPAALEMAVKEAAKKSPLDTNHAIAEQVAKESRARKFAPPARTRFADMEPSRAPLAYR